MATHILAAFAHAFPVCSSASTSAFVPHCPRNLRTSLPQFEPPQLHFIFNRPHRRTPSMGIKGLSKLLGDNAPRAVRPQEVQSLFGRKVAIDASMCIYQLLVAVRMGSDNLTNDDGNITSHLSGLFYRAIRLLELGIKPVFVFDGKPPEMKSGELSKRAEAKKAAEEAASKAREDGDLEAATRFSRRVNRITPEMMEACKTLLRLMGIPVVEAPCEAEAQCAELVRKGVVYAAASEDMDSLTFGTDRLIRQLWAGTASTASKKGIKPTEFTLSVALEDLELSMDQFIDLCILCGCDYVDGIRGVGVVKALNLVRKHGDLEKIVETLRKEKGFVVPDEYPVESLRDMFRKPLVTDAKEITIKWEKPKDDELKKFLVEDNQFDLVKVENGLKRLVASKKVTSQVRVDSFFSKATPSKDGATAAKRKVKAVPPKNSAPAKVRGSAKRPGSQPNNAKSKKAKT